MGIVAALTLSRLSGCADDPRGGVEPTGASPGPASELSALGYAGWDDDTDANPDATGVVHWIDGEAEELPRAWADDRSRVHLIAPSGAELLTVDVPGHTQVEFARPLPGRRILALSVDEGLTLLEADGTVVWQVAAPCHHEVTVVPREGDRPGTRLFAVALHSPRRFEGRNVHFDEVGFWEEATGAQSQDPAWATWSTWEHREALDRAVGGAPHALSVPPKGGDQNAAPPAPTYDYFHLNGIAFDGPREMIVCLRNVSLIAEVSLPLGRITHSYGPGQLDWPHAPSCVESEGGERSLLVFDNGTHRGWSRVVEVSRRTGEIEWEWRGTEERPLWSKVRGFAERLPGGNTLITESERGRAVEITRSGQVLWEFLNPELRRSADGVQRRRIYRLLSVPIE